jgi:hypothetical protein
MQLFENNTHYSRSQPDRPNFSRSQLRLPDNNNPATKTQANKPVETSLFLWERPLQGLQFPGFSSNSSRPAIGLKRIVD